MSVVKLLTCIRMKNLQYTTNTAHFHKIPTGILPVRRSSATSHTLDALPPKRPVPAQHPHPQISARLLSQFVGLNLAEKLHIITASTK